MLKKELVDPQNGIWRVENGGVEAVYQPWRHGCTIFEVNGLDHEEQVREILEDLKSNYGKLLVTNLSPRSPELIFWLDHLESNRIQGLADTQNQEIAVTYGPSVS